MRSSISARPRLRGRCVVFALCLATSAGAVRAANQTDTLSDVVIGGTLPMQMTVGQPLDFGAATLPTLHSFARGEYFDPAVGHSRWLVLGGLTNGLHDLTYLGFDPATQNDVAYVIDPVTKQVWGRPLSDSSSGLSADQIHSLEKTNAQSSQIGSRLYIAGGYGPNTLPNGDTEYSTSDTLSAIDLPGMMNWVRTGTGSAATGLRQIHDPLFQVTGGAMATSPSSGRTHLIFGQDYPTTYEPRQTGIYTDQVRSFTIVDNANGLSVSNVVAHPQQDDFRRRDLNVVPTISVKNGSTVDGLQALAGVFTPSFGVWTAPVSIDAQGNATEPVPTDPATFKQGMNGYKCATLGLYSKSADQMHTLLLGGISYEFYSAADGGFLTDQNIPFINNATDVVTSADGSMTQYLLDSSFPDIISPTTNAPFLLGAETEFFPADGVPTYANGVIDLDALTGPTVVGWLFGGIAAEQANFGPSYGSNAVFPVVVTPVPEPAFAALTAALVPLLRRERRARRAVG